MTDDNSKKPEHIKLYYFGMEGSAEAVRLVMALSGHTEFEDYRMPFSDWGEFKKETPYGQMPVVSLDGGPLRGQSGAMMRYVATTYAPNLYPKSCLFDIEEVMGLLVDMQSSWQPCLYMAMRPERFGRPEGFGKTDEGKALVKEMRENWIKNEFPPRMGYLEAWLDKNDGKWIATKDHPSIADCAVVPFLRSFTKGHIDHIPTDLFDDHPKLKDYVRRFCALPQIKGRYTDGLHE